MSDSGSFATLQERWVRGEPLSEAEERQRLEAAEQDPLARRELEWFAALKSSAASAEPSPTLVSRTLGALRGQHLRLVGPDERRTPVARGTKVVRAGALAAAAMLAVSTLWLVRRPSAPTAASKRAEPVASAGARSAAALEARIELVFQSGAVSVDGEPAAIGKSVLRAGQRVSTEAGRACVTLDPSIDVCLDERTSVSIESLLETRLSLRVTRGRAVAALTPRSAGSTFSLLLGGASATARGTVFAAELGANGARSVVVVEGKVEVTRPGGERALIPAHARLDFAEQLAGASAPVGRGDEARLLSLLAPRELWQDSRLGVVELTAGKAGARALIDGKGPFELPLDAFLSAGRHQLTLRDESGAERSLELAVESAGIHRVSSADFPAADAPALAVRASPRELLNDARERLARGDARGARTLYQRLRTSHPASAEAFTVLVTLGKLELDLGSPGRAIDAFDTYLKRGGPLAPEALSGKIRALRAAGRFSEERAAIQTYLARHENGFDAAALEQRLRDLRGR